MALPPQKFREIVFQILYSKSFPYEQDEITSMLMKELKVAKKAVIQAKEKAEQVTLKFSEIDQKIETLSDNYTFERISRVEKTILRLGAYELLFDLSLPFKVVFAEAVRLTKKFGTNESAQFVNAILDRIHKEALCTV